MISPEVRLAKLNDSIWTVYIKLMKVPRTDAVGTALIRAIPGPIRPDTKMKNKVELVRISHQAIGTR